MNSFRFPGPPTGERDRHSEPLSPSTDDGAPQQGSLISSSDEILPAPAGAEERSPLQYSIMADAGSPDETLRDDYAGKADKSVAKSNLPQPGILLPSSVKVKRAPVPLDFKQSASSNTIPASAFKALAGDEKTRRAVQSRLGSREVYEHMHLPSLDDLTMPPIASKITRIRDIGSPREHDAPKEVNDVFASHVKRRPSLPSAHVNTAGSSQSGISIPAVDLTGRFEQQRLEQKLEDLLEEKINVLRRELSDLVKSLTQKLSPASESMIAEVMSLFRTQLQESAVRSLDDSQLDARGEPDFELIRGVVQQGQAEMQAVLRSEVKGIAEHLHEQQDFRDDTRELINGLRAGIVNDFSVAISKIGDRILALEPKLERGQVANDVASTLSPILASLRSEPVDYEYLTAQLAQAVKPHISQLIDLASDKRETASLIVDKILPLLPHGSAIDIDAISRHLVSEIRRLVAPIDPFEIKEQVADLVVERLDSRLSLRDRTFNVETVSAKVHEGVGRLLEPVQHVNTTLQSLVESQKEVATDHKELLAANAEAVKIISDLPPKLVAATEALQVAEAQARSRVAESSPPDETVSEMKSTVGSLAEGQKALSQQQNELLDAQKDVLSRLDGLPESFAAATTMLKESSAAFASSHEALKRETDDLRKLNAEYQSQLSKARSAHGQARVEKDMLSESLNEVEKERDDLRAQVKELQAAAGSQSSETAALRAKVFEQEEALKRGLERLKADDVAAQVRQERIGELEKINRELSAEKQSLVAKVTKYNIFVSQLIF